MLYLLDDNISISFQAVALGILCFGGYVVHVGLTVVPSGLDRSFLAAGSLFMIIGAVSMTTIILGISGVILLNRSLLVAVSALVTLLNGIRGYTSYIYYQYALLVGLIMLTEVGVAIVGTVYQGKIVSSND